MHPEFDVLVDLAYGLAKSPEAEAHAASCAECRATLESLSTEKTMLQASLGGAHMSEEAQSRILAAVRPPRVSRRALAAAALLIACIGAVAFLGLQIQALREEVAALRQIEPGRPYRNIPQDVTITYIQRDPELEREIMGLPQELALDPRNREVIERSIERSYFISLGKYYQVRAGVTSPAEIVTIDPMSEMSAALSPTLGSEKLKRLNVYAESCGKQRAEELSQSFTRQASQKLVLNKEQQVQLERIFTTKIANRGYLTFTSRPVSYYAACVDLRSDPSFYTEVEHVLPYPAASTLKDFLTTQSSNR